MAAYFLAWIFHGKNKVIEMEIIKTERCQYMILISLASFEVEHLKKGTGKEYEQELIEKVTHIAKSWD